MKARNIIFVYLIGIILMIPTHAFGFDYISSSERESVEKKALDGDIESSIALAEYYAFVKPDREKNYIGMSMQVNKVEKYIFTIIK